jgi:hypothetical protein
MIYTRMIRKNIHLTKEQIAALEALPGNASEHIRRAVDFYLLQFITRTIASASKGGYYGSINQSSPSEA